MKATRRILFAVKDPATQRESAAQQAITLAKSLGASIEFFHSISAPVFLDLQPLANTSLEDLQRDAAAARREGLDKFVGGGPRPPPGGPPAGGARLRARNVGRAGARNGGARARAG